MRKPLANQKSYRRTDLPTYRPTDLPTDTASSRVACPRLKIDFKLLKHELQLVSFFMHRTVLSNTNSDVIPPLIT